MDKILKTAVMMSIRSNYVSDIVAGTKHIEFRTRFPLNYKGVIAVYESGIKSRHKVVLQFRTEGIVRFDPDVGITNEIRKAFRKAGALKSELEELKEFPVPVYCIPILSPTITKERTLQDFSRTFNTIPFFERPAQSWQWFKYEKEKL